MKTLFRTALYLALIVWLGAEIFFFVVAPITFQTLQPDTHTAGTIVGHLLRILHGMGLVSGMAALALLALAPAWKTSPQSWSDSTAWKIGPPIGISRSPWESSPVFSPSMMSFTRW